MNLFAWLRSATVSDAEVRAEIWSLGARHLGWPLEGALEELRAADISPARETLLRACVQRLQTR